MRKSEKLGDFFDNHTRNILLLLTGLAFLIILFSSLFRFFDHDELESVHTVWKIMVGEKIYLDFFQHHHSLFYYSLTPILCIFKDSVVVLVAFRLIIYLSLILIALTSYFIAKFVFNEISALISVILLLSTLLFVDKAIEIRPDVFMTLFSLASLLLFLIYKIRKENGDNPNKLILVLSAFSLALSFLFLQKVIFFVVIFFLFLLFNVVKSKISMRDFLVFTVVFFAFLAPYFGYLIISGKLSVYIFYNWIINMNFVQRGLPTAILSYKNNGVLWVFFVIGLLFFLKNWVQRQFGILCVALLVSTVFYKIPLPQYYMLLIPLVSIVSGYAVYKLFSQKRVIILVLASVVLLSPLFMLTKQIFNNSNKSQTERIKYVLSITDEDDFIYDGDIQFNLFRKDIDFFWYSLQNNGGLSTYKRLRDYDYDIYSLISNKKPKVISNYKIDAINNPVIKNNYVKSGKFSTLYIRNDTWEKNKGKR